MGDASLLEQPEAALAPGLAAAHRETVRRRLLEVGFYLLAILVALTLIGLLLNLLGAPPLDAYATMVRSALGSDLALALTLNKFTPILLGGAGVAFAMRAGYVNLGTDGQIYGGAVCGTLVAFVIGGWPWPLAVAAVLLVALAGGACFGLVTAALKHWWRVNELFATVMLNFVGLYLVDWVATGPWTDPQAGQAVTRAIPENAGLPTLLGASHIGVLLAIPLALLLSLTLRRTRLGFELRAHGLNPRAASLGGVRTFRALLVAMAVTGLVGGLAGGIEVIGVHHRLPSGISPNYGYMSVLIAVMARREPALVIPVAFLMAVLLVGGDALQSTVGLPSSAVLMFQALIVLAVLVVDALLQGGPRSWLRRWLPGSR